MNLSNVRIVLRGRDTPEILDLALRFILGLELAAYVRLAAVVLLPPLAACAALRHIAGWEWADVWLVALFAGSFLEAPFTILASRLLFGDPVRTRAVLRRFAARLPAYAAAWVAAYLALALGALLLFVWILPWIRTAFLHETSLLEGASGLRSLRRSGQLVSSVGGTVFGLLVALAAAVGGGVLVAELLGHALVRFTLQLGAPFGSLFYDGGSVYALAGYFATRPFVATARFLAYIDQRTRRDGWELQVRLMDLAAATPEGR